MATAAHAEHSFPSAIIQGREVTYPVVVRDASSVSATYLVDAGAARAMLPGDELDVVELLPGRALFSLACIDYRDNDLGDYNEVSFAFFVRERSAPRGIPYVGTLLDFLRSRVSTCIVWLPVDQAFTREAGERMWGFPKTIEQIDFAHDGPRAECTLRSGGRHVMTFSAPRGGARELPQTTMSTYTQLGGRAHATRFTSQASGVGFQLSGSELVLGDHPFAEKLRGLGLPRRPMMTVWMEHMRATFEPPRPL
ncbi:MAG TPA: acetoacetate decarboxylase family protein [Burkholderiales bacterium]|nr:acetoacetate decarboxylase family protein [Burkholderiales bacterium]